MLPRLFLRYIASSLEVDKKTRRLTSKQIDDIKKRCKSISNSNRTSIYGEIESFPTQDIESYLQEIRIKKNFKVNFKDAKVSITY